MIRAALAATGRESVRHRDLPAHLVEAGQGLLILEAMKMQNEVKAKGPGTVTAIAAVEGETVAAGAVLVTIEG